MKNLLRAACALAAIVAPSVADAAAFDFTFSFEQVVGGVPQGSIYTAAGSFEADQVFGGLYVVGDTTGTITNNFNSDVADIRFANSVVVPFAPASFVLSGGEPVLVDIGFNFFKFTANYAKDVVSIGGSIEAFGPLTTVSITPKAVAPAVPEPATWALMIAGFGAVGYAMRRRTRVSFAI